MRGLVISAGVALAMAATPPAFGFDLPARKAGLWSVTMSFASSKLPPRTVEQCVDAASEKATNSMFGGGAQQEACAKRDIVQNNDTIVVDSVCTSAAGTNVTHAVVKGSFDSDYTVNVETKRQDGPTPLAGADGKTHMSISAKWEGPCKPGQKPGDMIVNGRAVNMLDLAKRQQELQQRMQKPK